MLFNDQFLLRKITRISSYDTICHYKIEKYPIWVTNQIQFCINSRIHRKTRMKSSLQHLWLDNEYAEPFLFYINGVPCFVNLNSDTWKAVTLQISLGAIRHLGCLSPSEYILIICFIILFYKYFNEVWSLKYQAINSKISVSTHAELLRYHIYNLWW